MIFPKIDERFRVLFSADYLRAGSSDSQNRLMLLMAGAASGGDHSPRH
jgi:hypothetical protein